MAYINLHAPRALNVGVVAPIQKMAANLKHQIAARAVYSDVRRELNAMNDRELTDIGISRSMINDVAREAAKL